MRLGQATVARRVQIGLTTREQMAVAAGMSVRLLSDIENAKRTSYDPATLARLEQALGWQPGSAEAVLNGGLPALIPGTVGADDSPDDDGVLDRIGESDLPGQVKTILVDVVRAILERHRAERDALRDRQAVEVRLLLDGLVDAARLIEKGRSSDVG